MEIYYGRFTFARSALSICTKLPLLLISLTLGLEKVGEYLTPSHLPSSRAPWLVKYRRRQQKGVVGSRERGSPAAQHSAVPGHLRVFVSRARETPRGWIPRDLLAPIRRGQEMEEEKGGDFGSLLLPQAVSHSLVLAHLLRHNQTGFFNGLCLLF